MPTEAENQHRSECTASVEDSRYDVWEQGPRSPQYAQDHSQRPLRQFITPVEASGPTRDPFLIGLSAMSGSSMRTAYERSGPASMRNESICPSPKDNHAFNPDSGHPSQPHVIPTTAASIRVSVGETFEPVVFRKVGVDPWSLSLTAPDSHGGMQFSRSGLPVPPLWTPLPHRELFDVDGVAYSRYPPGPQGPLSSDLCVPSSHHRSKLILFDGKKDHKTQSFR